jgi:hypothetical protein
MSPFDFREVRTKKPSNAGQQSLLFFAPKIHIEFLCGRTYITSMKMQGAMTRTGMVGVRFPKRPADQRESDYWPEWTASVEDDATLNIMAQKNAPRIILGEAARMLAVMLVAVAVINVALGAFHIH